MDLIVIFFGKRDRDGSELYPMPLAKREPRETHLPFFPFISISPVLPDTYILEQGQHLRVSGIIRDRERKVGIAKNRSDPDQPRPPTRHNADILPGIFALLPLSVMLIVEPRNRCPERFNTRRRPVFARCGGDRDACRSGKAAGNIVIGFGCPLPEIGPFLRVLLEAVFVGPFGCPNDSG